ncbi:MAG: hypothetical protein ACI9P7_000666 [Candidatus Azotimanducaceae bacterium]|jgi:hypothetical protein
MSDADIRSTFLKHMTGEGVLEFSFGGSNKWSIKVSQ